DAPPHPLGAPGDQCDPTGQVDLDGHGAEVSSSTMFATMGTDRAITAVTDDLGIADVVVDAPPVNALTVAQWFALADTVTALGRDRSVRVVILRAEGRGFNAG